MSVRVPFIWEEKHRLIVSAEVITKARVAPVSSDEEDDGDDSDMEDSRKSKKRKRKGKGKGKQKGKPSAKWVRESPFLLIIVFTDLCDIFQSVGISSKGALFDLPGFAVPF